MRFDVPALPDDALAAAARFHADVLPLVEAALQSSPCVTLVFAQPGREHRGWRLAAVQGLARKYAPRRINAIEGGAPAGVDAAIGWLDTAEAVTGQLIALA